MMDLPLMGKDDTQGRSCHSATQRVGQRYTLHKHYRQPHVPSAYAGSLNSTVRNKHS